MTRSYEEARAAWRWRGDQRPPWAEKPGPGQESVWDYPRPPRVEPVALPVRVLFGGETIAETERALRVLETASPPTYYIPPSDVRLEFLEPAGDGGICEWKGRAHYWTVRVGGRAALGGAWSYPQPWEGFEEIRYYLSFYPGKMDGCFVDDEGVRPQPGTFYGGWITSNLAGPFKGEPGTAGW